ncbi:acetylajmalan esterase-like [Durio zibethinus]|uniref:Acetylajmalan esterase-like n=1 Tax=Durio zibethinus TaxID=66656 RepID=A0A6P5Z305_DURZI|nr:acetylajmalan esterase-like [Durio zibethinus]
MASSILSLKKWLPPRFVFSLVLVISSFLSVISSAYPNILSTCKFDAIYQLGDSISDTGNFIQENPSSVFSRLPYGETFFKKATGRCSDGLLMIDYLALSAEIPFLDAYLSKDGLFDHGVNFAVAGATALSEKDLTRKNVSFVPINRSLSQQLDWMFSYFNRTCHSDKDCFKKNERAFFMVGEIGGNDYNYAFLKGKTLEEVKPLVLDVVQTLKYAVKRVIRYGATRLVVPGNFPIGCFPVYLTKFQTNDTTAYDELHCLKELNNFSIYHNDLLQQAIDELKEEHPNVVIVYGNYYNAFRWILSEANLLGFDPTSLQKACCGIGGEYNFDLSRMCGDPEVTLCLNPNERLSWDGIHLTQRAYELMATWLIHDIYPQLQCEYIVSYSSAL